MAARKRASTDSSPSTEQSQSKETKPQAPSPSPAEPPIAPPKSGVILKLSLFFAVPYFNLIFHHYKIESELKRSILINAGINLAGYFAAVRLIPVASRYVLRRNLVGFDINKKGTPQGTVKVWVFFFFFFHLIFWLRLWNLFLLSVCFFVFFVFVEFDSLFTIFCAYWIRFVKKVWFFFVTVVPNNFEHSERTIFLITIIQLEVWPSW